MWPHTPSPRLAAGIRFLARFLFALPLVFIGTLSVPIAHAASISLTTCNASELVNAINTANGDGEADTITQVRLHLYVLGG